VKVKRDLVQGQEANAQILGERIVEPWLVSEAGGASLRECRDAPGIPAVGDYHERATNARVVNKFARAVAGGMCKVYVIWETPAVRLAVPYESFKMTDTTGLTSSQTEVHPKDYEQLLVWMTGGTGRQKTATVSYPIATRRLTFEGLFVERPPDSVRLLANKVNHAEWEGLPRGYWHCNFVEAEFSNRDNLYRVSVSVESHAGEGPWWTLWIGRDDSGEHKIVPASVLAAMRARAYDWDIITQTDGVLLAGMYDTADFGVLVGS
jgi:hypothetical protein